MCKWSVCVFVFGLLLQVSAVNSAVVIHELSGADSAQLGSNTTTIVCDYEYGNDTGVEIKWYYNDTVPIYLWVPSKNEPQPMGPFSNLLEVTNNTIHFKEMNRNLTGNYTCKVSSNEHEISKTEPLVAYQPAVDVEFFPEDSSETLICAAYEVYPHPTITVTGSYISESSNDSIFLIYDNSYSMPTDNDFLNVTSTFKYDKKSLIDSAEFTCTVTIPNTNYIEERIVAYWHPGNVSTTTAQPDFTTEASIAMINSTTTNSTNSTPGDAAPVSSIPSKCLMVVLLTLVLGVKF